MHASGNTRRSIRHAWFSETSGIVQFTLQAKISVWPKTSLEWRHCRATHDKQRETPATASPSLRSYSRKPTNLRREEEWTKVRLDNMDSWGSRLKPCPWRLIKHTETSLMTNTDKMMINLLATSYDKPTTAVSWSPSPTSRCVKSKFPPPKRFPPPGLYAEYSSGTALQRNEIWVLAEGHEQFRNVSCGFAGQRFRERKSPLSWSRKQSGFLQTLRFVEVEKNWWRFETTLWYSCFLAYGKAYWLFRLVQVFIWSSKLSYSCLNGIFSLCLQILSYLKIVLKGIERVLVFFGFCY